MPLVLTRARLRSRALAALLTTTFLSLASNARAEGPASPRETPPKGSPSSLDATTAPAAPAPPVAAPDVVRLRNGGILRGAISELVPGGDVVLITIAGELRRIAMRDVEYAGPIAHAPENKATAAATPAQSAATQAPTRVDVPVDVTANERGIALLVRKGAATGTFSGHRSPELSLNAYRELCVAPCTSSLTPGGHTLAASLPGGRIVEAGEPFEVRVPSKLTIDYVSKRDLRAAGIVTAVVGISGGLISGVVAATSGHSQCDLSTARCTTSDTPKYALAGAFGGLIVGAVGILIAIVAKDRVDFTLTSPSSFLPTVGAPAGSAGDVREKSSGTHAALRVSPSGFGLAF